MMIFLSYYTIMYVLSKAAVWMSCCYMTQLRIKHLVQWLYRRCHRYLRVRRARVAPSESCIAARVLQAETGLVSLSHFTSSDGVQEVVVAERVHAVVVSVSAGPIRAEKCFLKNDTT